MKAFFKQNNKKNPGFSLIEVIIYVSIFGIFVVSILSFFDFVNKLSIRNQTYMDVNKQGIEVSNFLISEIRKADSITSPDQTESVGELVLISSGDEMIFHLEDGILVETVSGQDFEISSPNYEISDLVFSNFSNDETAGNIHFNFVISNLGNSNIKKYELNFSGGASLIK